MIACIVCYMPFQQTHGRQKICSDACRAQNKKEWFKTEMGRAAIHRGWIKYRSKNPELYAIQIQHKNLMQKIKNLERQLDDIIQVCDYALLD